MKSIVFLASLAVLLTTMGCEEAHEHHRHHNQGYGGSYEGSPAYPDYGHGEYRGYPNYPDYRQQY